MYFKMDYFFYAVGNDGPNYIINTLGFSVEIGIMC